MKRYVLGFAFSPTLEKVVLIQKRKPEFQHGKFNGVGGKIEEGETPAEAMKREFEEETTVNCGEARWTQYVTMDAPDWICFCFFTILSQVEFDKAITATTEFIVKSSVGELPTGCMRNLHWLIPMALNWDSAVTSVIYNN